MAQVTSSDTQDTIIQTLYTPPDAITMSLDASVRPDPFLATPEPSLGAEDVSTSFLIPSTSFDVKQFTNLQDVVPEWEDEEVDEIMLLSPKAKSSCAVRFIPSSSCKLSSPSASIISSYQILQVLSSSSVNVKVALYKYPKSGQLYAVKMFSKSHLFYDAPKLEHAMTEQMMMKLLTQLGMPFLLKLRQSFQDENALYIVTEFCPGGDLRSLIERSGPLHPVHARFYAAELADALHFLHMSSIVHRAVAPEHVLVGSDGHVVLTGFSHSSVSGPPSPQTGIPGSASRQSQIQRMNDNTESANLNAYAAPEVILGWDCELTVDSWGFGMVLHFMLTAKHPFMSAFETSIHRSLMNALILYTPLQITGYEGVVSREAYQVLCGTLNRNPRIRMTMEEVKAHAYFVNTDWARLRAKGYEAPLAIPEYRHDISIADNGALGSNDSLSGVHITGFDFLSPDASPIDKLRYQPAEALSQPTTHEHDVLCEPERRGPDARASIGPHEPVSPLQRRASVGPSMRERPQADEAHTPEAPQGKVTSEAVASGGVDSPILDITDQENRSSSVDKGTKEDGIRAAADSVASNAHSTQSKASATPSASTALYSCTSFGELRDALKTKAINVAEVHPGLDNDLTDVAPSGPASHSGAVSSSGSGLATGFGFSSGFSTLGYKRLPDQYSKPPLAGIMRKSTSTLDTPRAELGKGRGLRKYASLDFDLDTIVSLDADLSNISVKLNTTADTDASGTGSLLQHQTPLATIPRRRVSFVGVDCPQSLDGASNASDSNAASVTTYTSTPRSRRNGDEGQLSPSWRSLNFSRYASPGINTKKLKKKRTASTPVLLNTPHLAGKVALPAGLEQIGLGIGYTHTPQVQEKEKGKDKDKEKDKDKTLETPRRSVSLGTNMVRYGALFANLARGRTPSSHGAVKKTADCDGSMQSRTPAPSEESDAMDAVMREMYGSAWDTEQGVGGYGGMGVGIVGPGSSRRRVPGRVYSVYAAEHDMDSTLRLVDPSAVDA